MRIAAAFLLTGSLFAAEIKLGVPLTLKDPISIDRLSASPADYVGKIVQVKGKVTEVCQMAGCWMALIDTASNKMIRISVNDGEIVFPKDAVGKTAIAEGKLEKIEMTKEAAVEKARHEAEEQGRTFHPESIKSGSVTYRIRGTGAVIL